MGISTLRSQSKDAGGTLKVNQAFTNGKVKESRVHVLSDLHIGARGLDFKAIKSDLDKAQQEHDLGLDVHVVINGDTFDAILPGDKKRFSIDAVDPRLLAKGAALMDNAVELAYDTLKPYAHLIRVIGDGNHDTLQKFHAYAPNQALLRELRRHNPDIEHGEYCGFFRLKTDGGGRGWKNWTLFRHHGAGGAAARSRGIMKLGDIFAWTEADAITIGHLHNRIADGTFVRISVNQKGNIVERTTVAAMSGSYLSTYGDENTPGNYASTWACPPQQKGGLVFTVQWPVDKKGDQPRTLVTL